MNFNYKILKNLEMKSDINEELNQKNFLNPFVVFRINSEKTINITKEIIKYLIINKNVNSVILENFNEINNNIIFDNNNDYKNKFTIFNPSNDKSDLCIIIGGDGTCLWANHLYKFRKELPPFITFHTGNLGYLVIYNIENYKIILDELYNSKIKNSSNNVKALNSSILFEHRHLIECEIFSTKNEDYKNNNLETVKKSKNVMSIYKCSALNEILFERANNRKKIGLSLYIDDTHLTNIYCDGLIFSSPTGSTAYNLSAGGPIIHFDIEGLIINAICSEKVFRPIILPRGHKVTVKGIKGYPDSSCTKDGMGRRFLKENEYAEMWLSDKIINIIILSKISKRRETIWKEKIINSLGWNNGFKH